jgi:hypothetical protein
VRSGRVALLAAAAVVLGASPARAHGGDPTLVPQIDSITPALPAGVVVQVRTGVSEQMLVANPTAAVLTVLDPDGTPFLQISAAGVRGNVADPFFHRTLNPPDVPAPVPASAKPDAKPVWVRLAKTGEFGWFEPRLHTNTPGTEAKTGVVSTWQIGMRLGADPVTVTGDLERRAVTGTFLPTVDPRADGLTVTVAPGQVPALLLIVPEGHRVVVGGSDGKDFLRVDSRGAFANTGSSNFRSNPDFVDRAGRRQGWVKVGDAARVRWLDTRLQYAADRPPEVVERAGQRADLGRWRIPMTVDGASAPLEGTVSWLPAEARAGTSGGGSSPVLPVVAAVFAVGVVTLAAVSRASRKRRSMEKSDT